MPYTAPKNINPDPMDAVLQAGTGMLLDSVAPGASQIQGMVVNAVGALNPKDQFGMGSGLGDFAEGVARGGTIGGIKSIFDRKKKQKAKTNWENEQFTANQQMNQMYVPDIHGNTTSFYAEEGGQPSMSAGQETEQQEPQFVPVNVELGEIAVNPVNFDIVQKFDNPNRFAKHNKNKYLENKGNFVQLDPTNIIIPKNLSERYIKGSALTRKSIIAELLKNQANREHAGTQETTIAPQMEDGGAVRRDPVYHPNKSLIGYMTDGEFTPSTTGLTADTQKWLSDSNGVNQYLTKQYGAYYKGYRKTPLPAQQVATPLIDYSAFTPDRTIEQRKEALNNNDTIVYQDTYGDGRQDVTYFDKKSGKTSATPWHVNTDNTVDYSATGSLNIGKKGKQMKDVIPAGVTVPQLGEGGDIDFDRLQKAKKSPRYSLRDIASGKVQIPKNSKSKYQPQPSVIKTKAKLAKASLGSLAIPVVGGLVSEGFNALGAGYDLGTSVKYAADGQWGKAGEDFGQAVLGLIPAFKGTQGIMDKGLRLTSKMKKANVGLKTLQVGSDVNTINDDSTVLKMGDGGSPTLRKKLLQFNAASQGAEAVDKITGFLNKPVAKLPSELGKPALAYTESPGSTFPTIDLDYTDYNLGGFTDPDLSPVKVPKNDEPATPPKPKKDWSVAASRAATAIPTIYGAAVASQQDPNLQYVENQGFDVAMPYLTALPDTVNIEASKAAMNRGLAATTNVLRNTNSPSVRAEMANASNELIGKTGELYQTAFDNRNQMVSNKLMQIAGLKKEQGANRENARVRFNTEASQDRAAREMMTQSALSEGVSNFGKGVMDDQRIKSINKLSKYMKINPNSKELVVENQDAVNQALAEIMGIAIPPVAPTTSKKVSTTETVKRDKKGLFAGSSSSRTQRD